MNVFSQTDLSRREYLLTAWKRALYVILGAFLTPAGLFLGFSCGAGSTSAFSAVPSLIFFCGGVYTLLYAFRARVVIEGSRIQVRGAFREESADLKDIDGYRTVSSRNGTYTQLCLRDGRGTITLSNSFETDGDYGAWFHQLTDLDKRERDAVLDEIAREEALGSSPDERLGALSRAKVWNILLVAGTIGAALALNFARPDLRLLGALGLALAPLAVLFMVWRSPLLYTVLKPRSDPRADLCIVLMVAGFGLLIRDSGVHLVAQQPILWLTLVITLAFAGGLYDSVRSGGLLAGRMIGLLILLGIYGYGLTVLVDTLPDQSQTTPFTTSVVGKHVTSGRSTSYVLSLAPWGPVQGQNNVTVSAREYASTAIGDPVCLLLHSGALHFQWYERARCPGRPSYSAQP